MAREISNQVQYYYDYHPTEEDLMGETAWHSLLIRYLSEVLSWLFHDQICAIYENLNFYQTLDAREYPVAPDLAIIKGVAMERVRSWAPGRIGVPPQVVFEILSEETWKKDLREKPEKYASLGVQEYFAYDPNEPPINRATARRLFGWRLDTKRREMIEMFPNADGWLWSEQLGSWLVPDGDYLRLYDREHRLRLTEAQAEALLRAQAAERAREEARRAEEQARQAEEARRQAAEEARQAEEARRQAEEARRQAAEEARRAQAFAEKLRALGINPDEVA
ncbi:MAG TPA: Uma2 family endonuclease [Ktedonobacteraceae bacterium]|nr:Uma2 family endonuclease [Ktedonobacteraceae bacterium]